jgi:hypothetical protein
MTILNLNNKFLAFVANSTILFWGLVMLGCDNKHKIIETSKIQLEISVVVLGNSIEGLQTIYDGTQNLEYSINGNNVGQGNNGEKNLLNELKKVENPASVKIIIPPRIVAGTGKAIATESYDLSEYIKDEKNKQMIIQELARIRDNH